MPTANGLFSAFLSENVDQILNLCLAEGFVFSVKESSQSVTVRCTLPSGQVRFIVFDDHRITNSHSGKPHVCNLWYKAVGDPVSFTMGKNLVNTQRLHEVLRATAVMCLTQNEAFNDMKTKIFS